MKNQINDGYYCSVSVSAANAARPQLRVFNIVDIHNVIKTLNGQYLENINLIRTATANGLHDADDTKLAKRALPYVMFSGLFNGGHGIKNMQAFNGLMCVDIDHVDNATELRNKLRNDPYTLLCFLSCSGTGVKCVIATDYEPQPNETPQLLNEYYKTTITRYGQYLKQNYGYEIDKAAKDIARACFISYDNDCTINLCSKKYPFTREIEQPKPTATQTAIPIQQTATTAQKQANNNTFDATDKMAYFDKFLDALESSHITIPTDQTQWANIAFAISADIGNRPDLFCRVSRCCTNYKNDADCEKQFNYCCNHTDPNRTGIPYLYRLAKDAGLMMPKLRGMKQDKAPGKTNGKNTANKAETTQGNTTNADAEKPQNFGNKTALEMALDFTLQHYDLMYNLVRGVTMIRKKDTEKWKQAKNITASHLYTWLDKFGYHIPKNDVVELMHHCDVPQINPIKQYYESLPTWDGQTDTINQLWSYLTTDAELLAILKKWTIGCVRNVFDDDYQNQQMVVLSGKIQGSGKSYFCKFLCPQQLKDYYCESSAYFKDKEQQLSESLFIVCEELARWGKEDSDTIKEWITRAVATFRPAYGRTTETHYRIANFIGSTNKVNYLPDVTGNRRFITIPITKINWNYSQIINIDDFWAQAYTMYVSGYNCELSADEMKRQTERNEANRETALEEELIFNYFEIPTKDDIDLHDPNVYQISCAQMLQWLVLDTKLNGIKMKYIRQVMAAYFEPRNRHNVSFYYVKIKNKRYNAFDAYYQSKC